MTPHNFAPYRYLLKRAREVTLLTSSASTLTWDLETYLPSKAVAFRAEELAHLRDVVFINTGNLNLQTGGLVLTRPAPSGR
jgi:Zn-dependent M32 family carboxypeptidase